MTLSFVQLLTPAWSLLHSKTSSLLDTMLCLFVVPITHELMQKHMDKAKLAYSVLPKQQFATVQAQQDWMLAMAFITYLVEVSTCKQFLQEY